MALNIKIFILCYIFLTITPLSVFPQLLPFRHYTTENNLSHSTVTSILQDNKGYMWFGTLDGISIYNGFEFNNINKNDGIIDRTVIGLYKDHRDRIWILSNVGFSIFENDSFYVPSENELLSTTNIWTICEVSPDEIWIGTMDGGINIIKNGIVSVLTTNDGLVNNSVLSIEKGNNGIVYVGTRGGLSIYHKNKFKNYTVTDGLPSNSIKYLLYDDKHGLFIGTNNGISIFNNEKFKNYYEKDGLNNKNIIGIHQGKDRSIWFATISGASRFKDGVFKSYTTNEGLASNIIFSIYEDTEHNIWFGTYNKGVSCLLNEEFTFYRTESGLISNIVKTITQDKLGNFWFGTSEGITVYDNKIKKHYTTENGLLNNDTWYLFTASNGDIWIGTLQGLSRYNGKKFEHFTNINFFTDAYLLVIFEDSKKNIWFGTKWKGLIKYDGITFSQFTTENGLDDNTVYEIKEDKNNILWIGTSKGTLTSFDGINFKHYVNPEINDHGPIYSITFDQHGTLWYTDYGNGIVSFANDIFTIYNTPDILPTNACVSIDADNDNAIWIGTTKGIVRFKDEKWELYSVNSGLISNEATYGSGYIDMDGNFWIGTMRGAIKFSKEVQPKKNPQPPVHITRLQIFENDTTLINGLELNHDQNFIRFGFIGISFKSPNSIEYKYKLIGLDVDWHTSRHRNVNYALLPPGKYEFLVKARNQGGEWNEIPASFSFSITPPFYNTILFRLLFIFVMVSLLLFFIKVKTVSIRKRNAELEQIVTERTKQLEQERNKADELLHNILPGELIKELKEKGNTTPREYKSISILFTDFTGFSKIAATLKPEKLVFELNDIFKVFDSIIEKHKLEKLKTIGDSYMIGGGFPVESEDHAYRIVKAAIEMQNFLMTRNKSSEISWQMRVGINSGQVIAGIVGKHKFTYDVWGNTVNIASALEGICQPGNITISEVTYNFIKQHFQCDYIGKIHCKGHGEISSYVVRSEILN